MISHHWINNLGTLIMLFIYFKIIIHDHLHKMEEFQLTSQT